MGIFASSLTGIFLINMCGFNITEISQPGLNLETIIFILLAGILIGSISHTGLFSYLAARMFVAGFFVTKVFINLSKLSSSSLHFLRW